MSVAFTWPLHTDTPGGSSWDKDMVAGGGEGTLDFSFYSLTSLVQNYLTFCYQSVSETKVPESRLGTSWEFPVVNASTHTAVGYLFGG